ncbi:unnamed protein product [Schistocephalus solidus]|uniref:Cytospin-A n=1 Tax=Schistocephalus solidus TaxID=70667 RepID=A0A183SBB7_SCHSO|nr:unnamed protein product [Schistocephalus solidus]
MQRSLLLLFLLWNAGRDGWLRAVISRTGSMEPRKERWCVAVLAQLAIERKLPTVTLADRGLLSVIIIYSNISNSLSTQDCIKEGTNILELIQENIKNARRRKHHPPTSTDATAVDQNPAENCNMERRQPLSKIRTKSSIDTVVTAPTLPGLANLKHMFSFGRF